MRKKLKKNSIKILKAIDENNFGSLARTLLSSFVLIMIFYSLPIVIISRLSISENRGLS